MKKFFALIAALIATTAVWAQTSVSTDSELRSAIANGANITVTADIDLSNSTLSIPSGTTVTINLNGHTLDRRLNSRGEEGGQVITVRSGAILNLSNGTLKGGWGGDGGGLVNEGGTVNLTNVTITGNTADDRGGGISNHGTLIMQGGTITNNTSHDHEGTRDGGGFFNYSGAAATLTNVTFNGNKATVTGGGGVCNYGTMTLDGCTITGNSCIMNGGGIWQGADATLNLQGQMMVTGNTSDGDGTNNFFLKTNAVINVTGSLEGSSIGVLMENNTGTFTNGYSSHNGFDPTTIFTSDLPLVMSVSLVDNEAKMDFLSSFQYIECSWDDVNKQVVKTPKTLSNCIPQGETPSSEADYKVLTGGSGEQGMVAEPMFCPRSTWSAEPSIVMPFG